MILDLDVFVNTYVRIAARDSGGNATYYVTKRVGAVKPYGFPLTPRYDYHEHTLEGREATQDRGD